MGQWDNVFEADLILEIYGGLIESGTWAYGMGNLIRETIKADFPVGGNRVDGKAAKFLSLVLFRANQLTEDPNFKAENFWKSEIQPEGDYIHYNH